MPLPSLTQRAYVSKSLKLIANFKSFYYTLENDAISSGSFSLCNGPRRRKLFRVCRCFESSSSSVGGRSFVTASPAARLPKLSANLVSAASRSSPSTIAAHAPPPLSASSSRSLSYLRPFVIDHYKVEDNVRPLDDVSFYFFQLLFTPEFCLLTEAITKKGFEIRIVGGAVRELVQGIRPYDIDFATDAPIDAIVQLVEGDDDVKERVRIIKAGASGAYGSVKVRVDEKQDFEITELRVDFSDPPETSPWFIDSARRDFTFNSMYLKLDGTLVDFHGGERDLEAGDVVFVGDSQDRIREDALRILRYFRFFGKVTRDPHHHKPENIRQMHKYRNNLAKVNTRRVWLELKKILKGEHIAPIFKTLHEHEILRSIGFPRTYSEYDLDRFNATCARTSGTRPHPCTLLADFFFTENQALAFSERLSLTKDEKELLIFLVKSRVQRQREVPEIFQLVDDLNSLKMHERRIVGDQWPPGKSLRIKDQVLELFKYQGLHLHILGTHWRSTLDTFKDWDPPTIPITLYDLIKIGISGWDHNWRDTFGKLTTEWQQSNYQLTKEELVEIAKGDVKRLKGDNTPRRNASVKKPEVASAPHPPEINDEDDLGEKRPTFLRDL